MKVSDILRVKGNTLYTASPDEPLAGAVALMAESTSDGKVGLGALGQYMKRTNPSFAPKVYGHSTLSDMVRCYPELAVTQGQGNGWWVSLKPLAEPTKAGSS